ncbi:MAG: hypothetical protein CSA62_04995 [Planctomycetota bacterium]|nr:MAG: hypothetical protein CSA62_04995 [Planctomycetota bacterium]
MQRIPPFLLLLCLSLLLWACGSEAEPKSRKPSEPALPQARYLESDDAASAQDDEELLPKAMPAAESEATESEAPKSEAAEKKHVRSWKRSQILPHQSRLKVGDKEELPQEALQVKVRIDGFRARVLLDGYYRNDRKQQFEGTFQLRLPTGATPWYLAFGKVELERKLPVLIGDVLYSPEEARKMGMLPEDVLRDRFKSFKHPKQARLLPRRKAAYAYDETVRQRVDPALMEWSGAGVFSTRVFPLEPGQLHRIVFGYDVDLSKLGSDWLYRLDLPAGKMRRSVDIELSKVPGQKVTLSTGEDPQEAEGRLYWNLSDPETRTIEVRISGPQNLALCSIDPKTGPYLAARFTPEFEAKESDLRQEEALFLLDTSLSSGPNAFPIQRKLLQAILETNADRIARFNVLFFDVGARWWMSSWAKNDAATRKALLAHTDGLSLEGATDLEAALRQAAQPSFLPASAKSSYPVFLLSDGAATWGEKAGHKLSQILKSSERVSALFAYRSGMSGTDLGMLTRLTRESGGALFAVTSEDQLAKAARAHRTAPWQLQAVECDACSDLMLAGSPTVIYPGQALTLVGRGHPKDGAEVVLKLRRGSAEQVVRCKLNARIDSELASRVYGEVATRGLEDYSWALQAEAEVYASYFRVAGPSCSLLMLESEAEYQRFGIQPQEHSYFVKKQPASQLLAQARAKLAGRLRDAKAEFQAMLTGLAKAPGLNFELAKSVQLLIDELPVESFYIASKPLTPKLLTWKDISGKLSEQLASRKLDYDNVSAEAKRRFDLAGAADAIRALSSLIENRPGDLVLLRDVAYSTEAWGRGDKAYHLLRTLAEKRPYEPVNWLGLARCLRSMQAEELALLYYEICLAGTWHERFGEFRKIATMEYLHLLRKLSKEGKRSRVLDYAKNRQESLGREFKLDRADLLVVIEWNTGNSDIDLHVWEPGGEHCYYEHPRTKIGGRLTRDVTQGYGPEMYVLPQAQHGVYQIKAHYFARRRNRASARSKVLVTIYEDWGGKYEKLTRKTIKLEENKQIHEVARVQIDK